MTFKTFYGAETDCTSGAPAFTPRFIVEYCVAQSLVFCVVFCESLVVLLSFFFLPLYCLSSFELLLPITPFISTLYVAYLSWPPCIFQMSIWQVHLCTNSMFLVLKNWNTMKFFCVKWCLLFLSWKKVIKKSWTWHLRHQRWWISSGPTVLFKEMLNWCLVALQMLFTERLIIAVFLCNLRIYVPIFIKT